MGVEEPSSSTPSSSTTTILSISLKWNKQVFEFDIRIPTSSSATTTTTTTGRSLKETIYQLTRVPVERQKIMVASGGGKTTLGSGLLWWKGMLKDDFEFFSSAATAALNSTTTIPMLKLTMMGSAEVLEQPTTTTTFVEDMTIEEQAQVEQQAYQDSLASVVGMIPALQTLPQHRSKDQHRQADEVYPYNRLVHGVPQYQIERLLQEQLQQSSSSSTTSDDNTRVPSRQSTPHLNGRDVMTLGLELQRAYVNDLTTLADGTLISGLEDGHVQLWKHGERVVDLIHGSPSSSAAFNNNSSRGVESVLTLLPTDDGNNNNHDTPAASFATAGRGTVQVWTADGEPLVSVSTPFPYASPTGLVQLQNNTNSLCLAARFAVTPPPSQRPRLLVPQDDAGRQRLAHIEAQEALVEQTLARLRQSVQVWYANKGEQGGFALRSLVLETAAPVTSLETWTVLDTTFLAAGDVQGGVQLWKVIGASQQLQLTKLQHYQLVNNDNNSNNVYAHSEIVCMKFCKTSGRLYISAKANGEPSTPVVPPDVLSIPIVISMAQGVHVLDVDTVQAPNWILTLRGHKDVVSCLLPLPNGDLITAGGKFDATMKVWTKAQLSNQSSGMILEEAATDNFCANAGYVFALTVLADLKNPSQDVDSSERRHFAVAVARYNVIKLIV